MDLQGARVLVTGATGGIGQALARELAARGSHLVLTGRRADVLEPLAWELNGTAVVADLSDRADPAKLLARAGDLDVVIANAALPASGLLSDYSIEQIDRTLDVNLRAPIVMAKLAAEAMAERGSGHLVFISSLAGKTASGQASMYNATKFGLRGFAIALREDMRPHGVGVSTIFPGFIRDAGIFADAGVTLPPGIGTRSPQDVARATARAIERNRGEVVVAPLGLRVGALFGGLAPGLSATIQRVAGGDRIGKALAEGQRNKR